MPEMIPGGGSTVSLVVVEDELADEIDDLRAAS